MTTWQTDGKVTIIATIIRKMTTITSTSNALAFQSTYSYQPSAEIPLMAGRRLNMLKALRDDKSMFTVSKYIKVLGQELWFDKKWQKAGSALKDNPMMKVLIHHIERSMLISMVRGTVAWDICNAGISNGQMYQDKNYPGTYICTLSIEGRGGAFLTPAELQELETGIRRYATFVQTNDKDDDEADWVSEVENSIGEFTDPDNYRFASPNCGPERLERLADMFGRLRRAAVRSGNTGQFIKQSPIMVGCSGKAIYSRYAAHIPYQRQLRQAPHNWALTCCLLTQMGLDIQVHALPVLCVYGPGQLEASEQLVTALCGSFVTQDGYNGQCPGGNTHLDNVLGSDAMRHLATSHRIGNNVDAAVKMANAQMGRVQNLQKLARLQKQFDDLQLQEKGVESCRQINETVDLAERELTQMVDYFKDGITEYDLVEQTLHEDIQLYDGLRKIFGKLDFGDTQASKKVRLH